MEMTPEQKALFDALTPLQKQIVTGVLAGLKPVDAYKASSGKAKTESSITSTVGEMMALPAVRAFMEAMQTAALTEAVMTRQEALERLSNLARADFADLVEFGAHEVESVDGAPVIQTTWRLKDSALQDPKKLAAIAELSTSREGLKIKTHSPLQAIQQLAKMQGWEAASKIEHSGTVQNVHYTAEDYKQAESRLGDRLDGLD